MNKSVFFMLNYLTKQLRLVSFRFMYLPEIVYVYVSVWMCVRRRARTHARKGFLVHDGELGLLFNEYF